MTQYLYRTTTKNAIHFIDGLIGKILEDMKDKGLLERIVILITGDHSEEFNDNNKNYWYHVGNYTKYQIQTPMI
ncbi:MAG: sulfatase-like hydrolase/transferase [Flavobacteriales bacterium]